MLPSPSPPLLRSIFVAPSSTALVHYVTAEWKMRQLHESLQSRRASEGEDTQLLASSAHAPEPREQV